MCIRDRAAILRVAFLAELVFAMRSSGGQRHTPYALQSAGVRNESGGIGAAKLGVAILPHPQRVNWIQAVQAFWQTGQ